MMGAPFNSTEGQNHQLWHQGMKSHIKQSSSNQELAKLINNKQWTNDQVTALTYSVSLKVMASRGPRCTGMLMFLKDDLLSSLMTSHLTRFQIEFKEFDQSLFKIHIALGNCDGWLTVDKEVLTAASSPSFQSLSPVDSNGLIQYKKEGTYFLIRLI